MSDIVSVDINAVYGAVNEYCEEIMRQCEWARADGRKPTAEMKRMAQRAVGMHKMAGIVAFCGYGGTEPIVNTSWDKVQEAINAAAG